MFADQAGDEFFIVAKLRDRAQHKLDFLLCKALVLDPSKPQQSCTVQSLLVGFSVQHNPCRLLHLRVNPVRRKRERFEKHSARQTGIKIRSVLSAVLDKMVAWTWMTFHL